MNRPAIVSSVLVVLAASLPARAEPCCDPVSPFRIGEGYADQAATCATTGYWLERAPDDDGRISMTVRGKLSAVEFDGTLAYLVMCEEPEARVLCVTYQTGGFQPGDTVVFGGGFQPAGENRIMLDPCLASPQ